MSTAIPRGPEPGSAGSAVQGQGSSRNPREGEGSSRSRGRARGGGPGSQRRAGAESRAPEWGSAGLLGGEPGARGRLRGPLSSREARTPASARQGPPAPCPSQPESDDPPAEQPQQPRASPRGRLPRPLRRERRTPLARTRLPDRPPVWWDWSRWKGAGADRPTASQPGWPPPSRGGPPSRLWGLVGWGRLGRG